MFKVVEFDNNNDADSVCKQLFKKQTHCSKKEKKIRKGKISKNVLKKKDVLKIEKKLKDGVRNILQTQLDSFPLIKTKSKKKKSVDKSPDKQSVKNNKNRQASKEQASMTKEGIVEDKQGPGDETTQEKKRKKRKKKKKQSFDKGPDTAPLISPEKGESKEKKVEKLKHKLQKKLPLLSLQPAKKQKLRNLPLRERMMAKLQAARFRFINEQIYSSSSKDAQRIFQEDPAAFIAYHEGYRQQVSKWPLNPVDVIIESIQRLPKSHIVADFGCGDAKLANSVEHQVHSFDLVAANESVTACDMAHVPLQTSSVDVAVFCLSLMGTNLHEYLLEANRVLKVGGVLKVAEVESRFEDINQFIEALRRFNFKNTWKDLSHNLFYFLDFKKEANIASKKKLPTLSLQPCLYKKR